MKKGQVWIPDTKNTATDIKNSVHQFNNTLGNNEKRVGDVEEKSESGQKDNDIKVWKSNGRMWRRDWEAPVDI